MYLNSLNAIAVTVSAIALVVIAYLWYQYRLKRLEYQRLVQLELNKFYPEFEKAVLSDGWLFISLFTTEDIHRIAASVGVAALNVLDELQISAIIRRDFNKHEGITEGTIRSAIKQWRHEKTANNTVASREAETDGNL